MDFLDKYLKSKRVYHLLHNDEAAFFMNINNKIDNLNRRLLNYNNPNLDTVSVYFEKINKSVKAILFLTNKKQFDGLIEGYNFNSNQYLQIEYESVNFSPEEIVILLKNFEGIIDFDYKEFLHIDNLEILVDKLNKVFDCYEYSVTENEIYKNEQLYNFITRKIDKYYEFLDIKEKPEFSLQDSEDTENLVLRIFDVGQANCSALIKLNNNDTIEKVICVFDIGCQKEKRLNTKLNDMLNHISNESTIIISHFDSDHFNNYKSIKLNVTNRWLFPEHRPEKYRASKLYDALLAIASKKSFSGSVYSYSTPYKLSPYLTIYQNNLGKKDPYQSTDENANSIVCKISLNEKRALIPADALYKEFHKDIFDQPYDLVIVPHHCCEYSSKESSSLEIQNIFRSLVKNDTQAVVMCGKNTYGHANNSHLSWYSNSYFFSDSKIYDDSKRVIPAYPCNIVREFFDFHF